MSDSRQSIGKGFAILSSASVIVKLLSLVFVPLMVNILGEKGNGVFGVTYQVFAFIYIIANSGFPVAVSKYVSELSERGFDASALKSFKVSRTFLIIIGAVLTILMIIISKPVAVAMQSEKATLGLIVLAPSIFLTSVLSAYRGYFQGRHNMIPTAVTQVVEQIVHTIFSVLFAYLWVKKSLEMGVAGSAVGVSAGALAALIMIIIYYNRYIKSGHAISEDSVKNVHSFRRLAVTLIKYSIPITISAGVQFGGNLIDAFVTKNRLLASGLTSDAGDVFYGYIYKYQQLINVPVSLITALSIAMLPAVAASVAIRDRQSAERKINYSFQLCFLVSVPAAFGMALLSDGVYSMLFFGKGSSILALGALTLILIAAVQIQTSILQSLNRLYYAVATLIAGIVIKVIFNYFLIALPSVRVYGALISTYLSLLTTLLLNMYVLRKRENLKINLKKEASKPVLSSLVMSAAICAIYFSLRYFLPFFKTNFVANVILVIASVITGLLVYFISMVKMKGITRDILNSISPGIYRLLPGVMKNMLD